MFFNRVEEVLTADLPEKKEELFYPLWEEFLDGKFLFTTKEVPKSIETPSYSAFSKVVNPQSVPKYKDLNSDFGLGAFIHSIVHIEYSAIDLALDACYRFRNLPKEFYYDWLEVAKEEIEHFKMLQEVLNSLGYKYGDFEVHNGLWEATLKTPQLLERMAFIPRHLEANGLDINEKLKERVSRLSHTLKPEILQALDIILRDEIDHVRKGDRWFTYACEVEGKKKESYFEILESILPKSTTKRSINIQARKKAGFSCEELEKISSKKPC